MNDFLTFLNTADLDTLTQVPGMSETIAERLIAARPFISTDECLKVKGMTKALLAKLELFAEARENESENRAMIPVREEAPPAFVDESQPAQESVVEDESFLPRLGQAFTNFLRALLRLILVTVLIVGIGAVLYFGLPYLHRAFIAPVERNTAEINKIETDILTLQTQLNEMDVRVDALEKSVEAHTASIQKLEEIQAVLETELQTNNSKVLIELKHEVMMTRVLDILGRARVYLAQSNFGLAKQDVESARDLLVELRSETGDELLSRVITRLDLALGNLPAFPVIASGDLEIAWQILILGEVPPTATPEPLPTITSTPEPTLEITPTGTP
jgi:hypothetical protein